MKYLKLLATTLLAVYAAGGIYAAQTVPWTFTFETAPEPGLFTILDSNDDNKRWEYSSGNKAMRISYNSDLAMDDWLITPAFQLQAGRSYKFSLDAAMTSFGPEQLEVFAGTAPAADAMTIPVIAKSKVSSDSFTTYSGEFTAPAAGEFYIGVHGCSDPDKLYLTVKKFVLVAGVSETSPAAVGAFSVIPDPTAALKVNISFSLPATTVGGSSLTSPLSAGIYCDGNLLTTLSGNPGVSLSYTHENAPAGNHTYMAVASMGDDRGVETETTVFVGARKPTSVTGLTAREVSDGIVELTWDVPKDEDGNDINPERITYKVVQNVPFQGSLFTEEDIEGADNLTETTFTHRAVEAGGEQIFTSYGVYAITDGGRSKAVKLPLFPVGKGMAVPYNESFADGEYSSLMRSETVAYTQVATSWDNYTDEAGIGITSQDGDNGFAVMSGMKANDCARLYTGKIDLSDTTQPILSFYIYNTDQAEDNNTLEVYASKGGTSYSFVKEIKVSDMGYKGWCRVAVPLAEYAGQNVQLALQGTVKNVTLMAIDNISVAEAKSMDMAVEGVYVPEKVAVGRNYDVKVHLVNKGIQDAQNVEVALCFNGETASTQTLESVAAGESVEVTFPRTADIFTIGEHYFTASVKATGDADADNNTSNAALINFVEPGIPSPLSLTAEAATEGVALQWTAPDASAVTPDPVTEDFESYEPFVQSFGNWTLVNADGNQNGKLSNITFPGINDNIAGGQSAGFWILDSNTDGLNATFASNSGSKCMAQIFCYGGAASDDWAISPELAGCEQTVKFMAKSYSMYLSETFEVLYSTTGTEISDFIKIDEQTPENAWTEFSYTLPEGAKYFAIRCTSVDKYMLLVDDVTYIPAEGGSSANLLGYNVYRNREKINAEPVATTSYIDTTAPAGTHQYHVSAVFDRGESAASQPVEVTVNDPLTSINGISAATSIKGVSGAIEISTRRAEGIAVYATDGRLMASGICTGTLRIPLATGVYLVHISGHTVKVIVK